MSDGGRWIWCDREEKLVPVEEYYQRKSKFADGPQVIRDIDPYKSVVTGEVVGGRRQHRDHLRAHGLIEVGNEYREPVKKPMPDARGDIAQVMREYGKIG